MPGPRVIGVPVVSAVLLLAAVPGCGTGSDGTAGGSVRSWAETAESVSFGKQPPDWKPCGRKKKERQGLCATVTVPLDYSEPGAGSLDLAVNRFPATGKKKGSLIVNPGGPGGSGLAMARMLAGSPLAGSYDIVGFDPRGVGASGQLHCLDQAAHDAYYAAPMAPTTAQGEKQRRQAADRLARACRDRHGELLAHLGTADTARDLETIRRALDEDRLAFLGASYGTLIGQYYAERYPAKIWRMYLDSVMDPALPLPKIIEADAVSAQQTLQRYLDHCLAQQRCPLGPDHRAAERSLLRMARTLDTDPVAAASAPRRPVTGSDLREAVLEGIGASQQWSELTRALTAAVDGDYDGIRALADQAHDRADDGSFSGEDETFVAVACTFATQDDRSHRSLDRAVARATRASALFGPIDTFRPCATWPAQPEVTSHRITADTPEPILLANNSVDPQTPLVWARAAAKGLEDATLVVNQGTGHGFMTMGRCTRDVAADYLLHGTIPRAGTACTDTGLKPNEQGLLDR